MEYRPLGKTGLYVSRLCFGLLTISPLQAGYPLSEGVALLSYAVSRGVNFFDTAELYAAYPYLRELLALVGPEKLVIATKSYAVTAAEMEASLDRACRELGRDWVDVFLLHEQESALTLAGHAEALSYLVRAKERGRVRAVGVSTHTIACVRAAAALPEVDVIHPLLNKRGLGIKDGTAGEMVEALGEASSRGKGIYLMTALAGGHLSRDPEDALRFAFSVPGVAAVAVGMATKEEVDFNVAVSTGRPVPEGLRERVVARERRLHIEEYCTGCGRCIAACPQDALRLSEAGKAAVDPARCILCGYCAAACEHFCIKVF